MQQETEDKIKKGNWIHLLHYDMAVMENTEQELKYQLPDWIQETHSPQLSVILQKALVFSTHHSLALAQLLKEERVRVADQHRNIIKIFSVDMHEKIKYCSTCDEVDQCIWTNLIHINNHKNGNYLQLLSSATELQQKEIARFLSIAIQNESRLSQWMSDLKNEKKETMKSYYLVL